MFEDQQETDDDFLDAMHRKLFGAKASNLSRPASPTGGDSSSPTPGAAATQAQAPAPPILSRGPISSMQRLRRMTPLGPSMGRLDADPGEASVHHAAADAIGELNQRHAERKFPGGPLAARFGFPKASPFNPAMHGASVPDDPNAMPPSQLNAAINDDRDEIASGRRLGKLVNAGSSGAYAQQNLDVRRRFEQADADRREDRLARGPRSAIERLRGIKFATFSPTFSGGEDGMPIVAHGGMRPRTAHEEDAARRLDLEDSYRRDQLAARNQNAASRLDAAQQGRTQSQEFRSELERFRQNALNDRQEKRTAAREKDEAMQQEALRLANAAAEAELKHTDVTGAAGLFGGRGPASHDEQKRFAEVRNAHYARIYGDLKTGRKFPPAATNAPAPVPAPTAVAHDDA
jgi:hypothetical protein